MEDIAVMPIVAEVFYTFPEWDVQDLEVDAGKVQFFRDGYQVVRFADGYATRYHAEFIQPRRYENTIPPVTNVPPETAPPEKNKKDKDGIIFDPFTVPTPKATYMDRAEPPAELPTQEIAADLWEMLPRERRNTGGYWRDDEFLYYQLLGQGKIQQFRPMIRLPVIEPIANAQDGTDVIAEPAIESYAIERADFDALPEWTPFEVNNSIASLFRDGGQIVQYVNGVEKRFVADFGEIPF